jgi:hypothetical protein
MHLNLQPIKYERTKWGEKDIKKTSPCKFELA